MIWNAFEASWKQMRDRFALKSFRLFGSARARLDAIGTETGRVGQRDDLQPAAFRPDEQARRSESSLHISC